MEEKGREDTMNQCPYYKEDQNRMISCEGPYQKSKIHLGYSNSQYLQNHKKRFCHGRWFRCALAEMNNRMYDYDPR